MGLAVGVGLDVCVGLLGGYEGLKVVWVWRGKYMYMRCVCLYTHTEGIYSSM